MACKLGFIINTPCYCCNSTACTARSTSIFPSKEMDPEYQEYLRLKRKFTTYNAYINLYRATGDY